LLFHKNSVPPWLILAAGDDVDAETGTPPACPYAAPGRVFFE
jgi:hypothetical protein